MGDSDNDLTPISSHHQNMPINQWVNKLLLESVVLIQEKLIQPLIYDGAPVGLAFGFKARSTPSENVCISNHVSYEI